MIAIAAIVTAAVTGGSAVQANAFECAWCAFDDDSGGGGGVGPVGDGGSDKLVIYEPAPDDSSGPPERNVPHDFRLPLPGMTQRELGNVRGGGNKGGDKSGVDKNAPEEYANRNAGKNVTPKPVTLNLGFTVHRPDGVSTTFKDVKLTTIQDLSKVATVEPGYFTDDKGNRYQIGVTVTFNAEVLPASKDLAAALFSITGGSLGSCKARGSVFMCDLDAPKYVPPKAPVRRPDGSYVAPSSSERQVPLCDGVIVDGGVGVRTVITPESVSCDAAPGKEPVRLLVDTLWADPSYGIPASQESDGSILYYATDAAQGHYVSVRAWAVSADGTTSWPFYVVIRNRYAPQARSQGPVEAIRGVDTVIPANQLFTDEDIDKHFAESNDRLTSEVVSNGVMGGAYFDPAGNLHYRSIDVIRGDFTDHVTVKTVDSFGLPSGELTLAIHISDVAPGCLTDGTTTDAATPVRVVLHCWITPVDGWRQISGLDYSIVKQPEFGTLSGFDPNAGVATYTPDPEHPGPVTFEFKADNNGASRTARYTVNVLPVP